MKPKINFTVTELVGCPIYLFHNGLVIEKPLTNKDDIKDGLLVCCELFGGTANIRQNVDGSYYVDLHSSIGFLSFDEDERHCWTLSGMASLSALSAIRLISETE